MRGGSLQFDRALQQATASGPRGARRTGGRLSSLVLAVQPNGPGATMSRSSGSEGRALHAALLRLVREKSPALAEALHSDVPQRAFTVGMSWLGRAGSATQPVSRAPWVRFTSFDPELSLILDELRPRDLPCIRIHDREQRVIRLCRHQDEHRWAAQGTFVELYNNGLAVAHGAVGDQEVSLEFASPTAFQLRDSRLNMPLPWPRLVFQSLAEKWNASSPIPLWIDWPQFDRVVTVSRHSVQTSLVDFGRYRQIGFVGTCRFLISVDASRRLLAALYTLADFALYAGVGKKTTMGMGMTCRLDPGGRREQWHGFC